MTPLNQLGAAAAAAAIARKEITATALVQACLDRIAAREPVVGAWIHLDAEAALAQARARDAEAPRGPLHGVPIGVKDIIDTADMPTGYGSPIYAGKRPYWDAAAVSLMRRAGAIVIGKTVSTEFAYFTPGKTANPINPAHTPGGSSSGSAAAVADHMVPLAFGSQTAASITRPSAFCGVVGFKPSWGSFALAGIKPFAPSFDTLGTITRSVADARLAWSVLHGIAPVAAGPVTAPRIGFCRTPQGAEAEPPMVAAFEAAMRTLAAAGAAVEEITLPPEFSDLVELHKELMAFEAARSYAYEWDAHRAQLSPQLAQLVESGLAIPLDRYLAGLDRMQAAQHALSPIFARVDALVAPAAKGEAPKGLAATGDPVFSRLWTLLHVPSLTVKAGTGPNGLPLGLQVIADRAQDRRALDMAEWVEARLS